ncbi:uncharacterized protein BCR38DRAFT_412136, partial [Pseudomassariella vexata]
MAPRKNPPLATSKEPEAQVEPRTRSPTEEDIDSNQRIADLEEQVQELDAELQNYNARVREQERMINSLKETIDAKDRTIIQQAQQIANCSRPTTILPSVEGPQIRGSTDGNRKGADVVILKNGIDPTVTNWIMLIRDKFQDEPMNYPDEQSQIRYCRK